MLIIKQETGVTKFTIEFTMDELKLFVAAYGATNADERDNSSVTHYEKPLLLSRGDQINIWQQLGILTGSKILTPR